MGLFGGDDGSQDRANALVEEQIRNNAAELEQKRQSLYQTKLDLYKASGGQSFTPDRTTSASSRGGNAGHNPSAVPGGMDKFIRHWTKR